jgi:hypothetical protein
VLLKRSYRLGLGYKFETVESEFVAIDEKYIRSAIPEFGRFLCSIYLTSQIEDGFIRGGPVGCYEISSGRIILYETSSSHVGESLL